MISLLMEVERVEGRWYGFAPWGEADGESFEDVYWQLAKMRSGR